MCLMDTWIHRDRTIKIERTTSNNASSSRSCDIMWMLYCGSDGRDLKTLIYELLVNLNR